jgi:hypothetical protein
LWRRRPTALRQSSLRHRLRHSTVRAHIHKVG